MKLDGKQIAILVADGFEQIELTEPRKALEEAGAKTVIISPSDGKVQGWNHDEKADFFTVDAPLKSARAEEYDALLLPGGVKNPDKLRTIDEAVQFVQEFVAAGKPIAVICHGPWTLIEADAVEGKTITSWPSVKTDLRNAGANWVDEEVVVDQGLISSRKPEDIPAFNEKMVEEFANAQRSRRAAG